MNHRILIFLSFIFIFSSCASDLETIEEKENGVIIESYTQRKSDGEKHGNYTSYYPTGEKNEVSQYENGKINGTQIFYHKNGKIAESASLVNGEYAGGYQKFYESGELEQEGNYVEGAMNGEWKYYYANGKMKEIVPFKNNEEFGPFKEYHDNGMLKTEGTYKGADEVSGAALEDGELKKYDEQGVHYQTMNCDLGLCLTTWKKEGVVLEE